MFVVLTVVFHKAKKWQYVFLKHGMQFGLNVSVALFLSPGESLPLNPEFRIYFLIMTISFVVVNIDYSIFCCGRKNA
jgi:hypothetical protein